MAKQLVVEITELQAIKLNKMCPHGTKKHLIQAIIESLFELYSRKGRTVVTALLKQEDVQMKELLMNERLDNKLTQDLTSIVSLIRTRVLLPKKTCTTYSDALDSLVEILETLPKGVCDDG